MMPASLRQARLHFAQSALVLERHFRRCHGVLTVSWAGCAVNRLGQWQTWRGFPPGAESGAIRASEGR
jgi:hypothetical protein